MSVSEGDSDGKEVELLPNTRMSLLHQFLPMPRDAGEKTS